MNQIIEDLKWRYACKKFNNDKKISEADFTDLLESLRLTASSYGLQPWKFVVVENKDLREQLVAASYHQTQVKDASHLIVMCKLSDYNEEFVQSFIEDTAKTREQSLESLEKFKDMLLKVVQKPKEQVDIWAKKQIYIALGNFLTVCAAMKIDCCPMEGFQSKKYNEILGLDKLGLSSVLVCPVGYRADDDKYADSPKVRFPLSDLVISI